MKPGPKPKSKCSKGHIIAEVGRTKAGACRKCQSDYYKIRWNLIRKQLLNDKNP